MILQDAIDDLIKLVGVFCPMYDTAVFFGFSGKLVEIFVKMGPTPQVRMPYCHVSYVLPKKWHRATWRMSGSLRTPLLHYYVMYS